MTFHDKDLQAKAIEAIDRKASQKVPFAFYSPDDLDGPIALPENRDEPKTVAGLLCRTGLTLIFGKGNSMKTWFALSVMVHCAAVGSKAPTHIYDPQTGLEIVRRGRSTIYTAEDTYERVDRRVWSIIVNDLGMDPAGDDAKATRKRIRVIAPLSMTDEQFPFDTAYLFDDEGASGRFAANDKCKALVDDMNRHNAGREANDAERHILLVVDSVTTTGGMELTDNKESTVFCWFLNKKAIAGDFAVLALAHSVKSANPDKLDPEAGRAERLAGGFAWSTNVRATIEVRRPLGRSYTKGRGGKIVADDWWESMGLPQEHSRAICVQVAKENVGGLPDLKMWFSPRRVGAGAFHDITKLMRHKPRSFVQYLEWNAQASAAALNGAISDVPAVTPSSTDRSLASALVLKIATHIATVEKKPITANAVQARTKDAFWKQHMQALVGLKPAEGGIANNGTRGGTEIEGSSRWLLDRLVVEGALINVGRSEYALNPALGTEDEEDSE